MGTIIKFMFLKCSLLAKRFQNIKPKKELKKENRETQRGSRILIILNDALTNNINISSLADVPSALFDLIYILYTVIL